MVKRMRGPLLLPLLLLLGLAWAQSKTSSNEPVSKWVTMDPGQDPRVQNEYKATDARHRQRYEFDVSKLVNQEALTQTEIQERIEKSRSQAKYLKHKKAIVQAQIKSLQKNSEVKLSEVKMAHLRAVEGAIDRRLKENLVYQETLDDRARDMRRMMKTFQRMDQVRRQREVRDFERRLRQDMVAEQRRFAEEEDARQREEEQKRARIKLETDRQNRLIEEELMKQAEALRAEQNERKQRELDEVFRKQSQKEADEKEAQLVEDEYHERTKQADAEALKEEEDMASVVKDSMKAQEAVREEWQDFKRDVQTVKTRAKKQLDREMSRLRKDRAKAMSKVQAYQDAVSLENELLPVTALVPPPGVATGTLRLPDGKMVRVAISGKVPPVSVAAAAAAAIAPK